MKIVLYKNTQVKVFNDETLDLEPVDEIPQQQLFVSQPDDYGRRYAFNIEEIKKDFILHNRFYNFYSKKNFSKRELDELLTQDPKLKHQATEWLTRANTHFNKISPETLSRMNLFFINTGGGATNTQSIEAKYTEEELLRLGEAGVSTSDLARGETFAQFKKYYSKLSTEEKKAIDEFPEVKKHLRMYDLGESLENIFNLPANSCLGGTAGICKIIIDAAELAENLKSVDENQSLSQLDDDSNKMDSNENYSEQNESLLTQLQLAIQQLDLNAAVEINPGTTRTPGTHLRISGFPSPELSALPKALKELGIDAQLQEHDNRTTVIINDPNTAISVKDLQTAQEKAVAREFQVLAFAQLQLAIQRLDLNASVEVNPGTTRTPGMHLCISGVPSAELSALPKALKELGIDAQLQEHGNSTTVIISDPNTAISLKGKIVKDLQTAQEKAVARGSTITSLKPESSNPTKLSDVKEQFFTMKSSRKPSVDPDKESGVEKQQKPQ